MLRLLTRLQAFLFSPVSASGFGLMRVAWAGVAFVFFLMQWSDVTNFYSSAGVLPAEMEQLITRGFYRFTILDTITDPGPVFGLYLTLLGSLVLSFFGVLPRLSTIVAFVLMASFHERNTLILGGGDTVLRTIGFLLCIAPTLNAFSVSRLRRQWRHWRTARTLLPDLTMSIWPYRLLLWQMIVIYIMSVWLKTMGTMWENGTATTAALQHEMFIRWPREVMAYVIYTAPFATFFAMAFESAWALLLIPRSFTRWALAWEYQPVLKRWLILLGFIFHGGIFLVMDVGVFSLAMFAGYCGLLLGEDFAAIRKALNRRFTGPIKVFFDGHCGLCLRSVFGLQMLDRLGRLTYVDFRDERARKAGAPDLSLAELDKALHIRFPSGRTLNGFNAFRALSWHLPVLWPVVPFLYVPGVPWLGRKIYAHIADRRKRCMHQNCGLKGRPEHVEGRA